MKQELENKLSENFPFMKARNVWTNELCFDKNGDDYGFPCACGDGWYQLIHDLCQELTDYYTENNLSLDKIQILQIKEKFGELRFYVGSMYGESFDIIEKYNAKSTIICEVCGDEGELVVNKGWYQTLCKKHQNQN